jgi:hypothetical protein
VKKDKSKDQINNIQSPDDLNSYLRVTNPSMWFVFGSIMVLLIGFIIGSSFYKIKSTVYMTAVVRRNVITVVPSDNYDIEEDMTVYVEVLDSKPDDFKVYKEKIESVEFDKYEGDYVGLIYGADGIPDGNYSAYTEITDTPISYLFH